LAVALTIKEARAYVTPEDQALPKERQTTWWLRALPYACRMLLMRQFGGRARGGKLELSAEEDVELMAMALRLCLVGVDNLVGEDGTVVPFEQEDLRLAGETFRVPTPAFLNRLDMVTRLRVSTAALDHQFLGADDRRG
jgi:hypothetical protein